MRLIDADALMRTHKSEVETIGKDWTVDDLATAIETAPTIDAIPMEWLRDMMLECEGEESRAAWVVMREWRKWKQEQEVQDGIHP